MDQEILDREQEEQIYQLGQQVFEPSLNTILIVNSTLRPRRLHKLHYDTY
jgi:hypothetical protein